MNKSKPISARRWPLDSRNSLLARGEARSIIWREGALPDDAPNFSLLLSYDLLSYGYGLLGLGLRLRELGGNGDLARAAFEHAASGIGRAIAAGLAADGFSVVVADLDEVNGRAAAKEIAASNQGRAIFQRVDVTDRTSVSAAIDACTRQCGSIKVMVNNAGFNKPEPFLEASEAIWQKIMDVNALGVMIGIQEAAKAMIAAGTKGKIINTASIAGRTGYADWAPYCASKFAVVALTHAGARALADRGITVNAFAPGVVATPLWEQLDKDLMAMGVSSAPGEAMENFSSQSCLVVSPSPVTSLARSGFGFAASDYMTGQVLMIDGGMICNQLGLEIIRAPPEALALHAPSSPAGVLPPFLST